MRKLTAIGFSAIALALFAQAAAAQEPVSPPIGPDEDEESFGEGEIVVVAQSLRGAVDAPQPPVLELGEEDIAAYGASSISDLIAALGPQTGSGRGRGSGPPAILVNGTRVSSFRELRSYPPEAILRVEVFPEEVALRYGFSADQRVVNFILKDDYQSREIEAEYGQPWDGGYSAKEVEATYLLIDGATRYNVNIGWNDESLLTEAERGIVQSVASGVPGDPDPAPFRSLQADTAELEITGNMTTRLGEGGSSLSLNGTFERADSLRLQGLDTIELTGPGQEGPGTLRTLNAGDPLTVDTRTDTYGLGGTLNAPLGGWQLTATVDGTRTDTSSRIARRLTEENSTAYADLLAAAAAGTLPVDGPLPTLPDAGFDEANTRTDSANSLVTVTGSPLWLPAGDVSLTFDAGYNWTRIRSEDTRDTTGRIVLTRGDLSAGANLSVPITSVRDDFGAAIGDLSFNASAGINHLSDFGTLTDWTVGLTWSPFEPVTFTASYIAANTAPTLSQLGDPEIATPNVPIFDLARNETVLATAITGGNPTLPEQSQRDWKIGAMVELPFFDQARFSIDYFRNRSEDVAAAFPVLTPEIEAAFPGRVTRDETGRLIQLDQRAVTFAEQRSERLQFGLNFSGALGPEPVEEERGGGGQRFGAAGGFAGGPPSGGAAGPGAGFDPERMAQLRQQFCAADQPVEPTPEVIAQLPEPLQQRLRGEDGQIDPQRWAQFRERICSQGGVPPQGGTPPSGAAPQGGPQGGGQQAGGPPGGGGGPRMPFGRGPGGNGRGRWMVNLQYTLELDNTVLIAPGVPELDLLDGDALTGGGQPRHSASVNGAFFYKGFGTFYNLTYTGASTLDGSGLPGSTDLQFDDLLTVDLRLFADLNQRASLIEAVPLLRNTRISFSVDNVFDARQRVTDSAGEVPLRYQPFLVDPIGRYFEVELRKLF